MDETEETTDTTATSKPKARIFRIQDTPRAKELRTRLDFVEGKQHDHKQVAWSGKSRQPGIGYLAERLLPLGFQPMSETPYEDRRPSSPIPMARQVTARFTDMLLGENRQPTISVAGDVMTEGYLEAVFKEADQWDTLASVRDGAGACGSCALRVGLIDGKPYSARLDTTDLYVKEWAQHERWIPRVVFWQKLVEVEVEDKETGRLTSKRVWKTMAWDETYEYTYDDVSENFGSAPGPDGRAQTEIPMSSEPIAHGAGRCPIVWAQNTRNTDCPEGEADNEGVYELGDAIDKIASMLVRGTIANIDPTLHIADEPRNWRRMGAVRKGWGNLIRTSERGKVNLVQISEGSFKVGWTTYEKLRQAYLQTVRCVIVDPETAGKYQSGEAQSMLWRAMEGACGRKRVPLSDEIRQVCQIWLSLAETHQIGSTDREEDGGIQIPPRVMSLREAIQRGYDENPVADLSAFVNEGNGDDTGPLVTEEDYNEVLDEIRSYKHRLGPGRTVDVVWGPYHDPTAQQTRELATAVGVMTGQKPVISQQTGTRIVVRHLGLGSPEDEIERIEEEKASREAFQAATFGPDVEAATEGSTALDDEEEREDEDEDEESEGEAEPIEPADEDGED